MKFRVLLIILILIPSAAALARGETDKGKRVRDQQGGRTIPADPAVTVSICVASANVTVHGWDKNEVLALTEDAQQIELQRRDATTGPNRATRIEVLLLDKAEGLKARRGCQGFSDVTINVPRGASVQVQTRDGNISIAEVGSAYAGSQNGDINIEHVSRSIEVSTLGGSISLKNSSGRVKVNSAGGSLEASNLRPVDDSDGFEAATVSGDISLDKVSHAQLTARTVNGNMNLTGPLARNGRYGFRTMSGDVTLAMPADASFQLAASLSSDCEIVTDFPLKLTTATASKTVTVATASSTSTQPVTPPAQPAPNAAPEAPVKVEPKVKVKVQPVVVVPYGLRRVNAVHGSGDAVITVASFSGTLHLQKI
jgi:Putative adhesin